MVKTSATTKKAIIGQPKKTAQTLSTRVDILALKALGAVVCHGTSYALDELKELRAKHAADQAKLKEAKAVAPVLFAKPGDLFELMFSLDEIVYHGPVNSIYRREFHVYEYLGRTTAICCTQGRNLLKTPSGWLKFKCIANGAPSLIYDVQAPVIHVPPNNCGGFVKTYLYKNDAGDYVLPPHPPPKW